MHSFDCPEYTAMLLKGVKSYKPLEFQYNFSWLVSGQEQAILLFDDSVKSRFNFQFLAR